jgi:hypothetical protein
MGGRRRSRGARGKVREGEVETDEGQQRLIHLHVGPDLALGVTERAAAMEGNYNVLLNPGKEQSSLSQQSRKEVREQRR